MSQRISTGPTVGGWLQEFGALAAVALVSNALAAGWYVSRFGRSQLRPQPVAPATDLERSWLAPPRRSAAAAILWKQMRESTPLALLGAAATLAIGAIIALSHRAWDGRAADPQELWSIACFVWGMVGMLVTIVAGIGLFMDDLKPGLHTFWRSRPINVNQWFWLKFFAGLTTTLILLIASPAAAGAALALCYDFADFLPNDRLRDLWLPLAGILVVQVGVFSAAVAAMTLLRQPLFAAVVTIGCFVLVMVGMEALDHLTPHGWVLPVGFVLAAIAAPIALAWAAVQNNWGWESQQRT
jgi:hypothetical protein